MAKNERQKITSPDLQKFGQTLRQIMAGILDGKTRTLTTYAQEITKTGYPISRVQLSNYINYKSLPSAEAILKISHHAGITTDQLLKGLDYIPDQYKEAEAKAHQADTLSVQTAKLQASLTKSKAQLTLKEEENKRLKEEIEQLKQSQLKTQQQQADNNQTGDDLDFLNGLDQLLIHSNTYNGYRLNDGQKATIKRLTRAYLDV